MTGAFPAIDKASVEPVNILVVDDLPDKLLAMKTVLEDLGETLVCVQSGREALRRIIDQDFAVILLDVNMPEMDGLETAQLIRQREKSRTTPIIFITAFADDVDEASVYSMGAVDYIMSPVSPQILRSKVSVFVELHRKRELIRRQADERVQLAHEQAARASAEEAERRSAFLANAGALVSRSLDLEETLQSLARVMVPELGREGVVHLLPEGRAPGKTIRSRALPDGTFVVDVLAGGLDELDPPLAEMIQRALASGRTEMTPDSTKMGAPRSTLVVPVGLRGKVLGALAFPRPRGAHGFRLEDRGVAEDLAARVAHAVENARLYKDIQERDTRKNEFLAMLAHELRSPLAPITTAVELLRLANDDPKKLMAARGVIERQVRQMARLVDDLLDVARITSGKVRLELRPIEVQAIVSNAVETTRPLVEKRRQKLTVELPDRPLSVQGDQARLGQVLANLINNACKYTDEGGSIGVKVEEAGDQVVLTISDTGVGISEEMMPMIFDLFTQADRSLDHSQGGLGIGLTVVRRLVELHGGQVEARSEGAGRGSQFVVRLPRLEQVAEPEAATPAVRAGSAGSASRILVVDDNVDAAELLAELLRMVGHDVSVAYDGLTGLAEAERVAPDFTLLDIGLPGLDGYEVARRIRARPHLDGMVLVAITGYGQDADMHQAKDVGFDHHLVKPVSPETLVQILAASPRAGTKPQVV